MSHTQVIIIYSFYSLWNIRHPWRASKHCDLQLSPSPHSMIFLCFLFHPLLSFTTFSSACLFFYTPEDSSLMRFSLLPLPLYVMCVQSNSIFLVIGITIYIYIYIYIYLLWCCDPTRVMLSSFVRFPDHTRLTTVGRTPLDEWSARRRDLWQHTTLTTNIHARGGIRTHSLRRRAATGTGNYIYIYIYTHTRTHARTHARTHRALNRIILSCLPRG